MVLAYKSIQDFFNTLVIFVVLFNAPLAVFLRLDLMTAGTLGLIMTSPGQTYAVSIFIEHFLQDLSFNRTTVSVLYTGATLLGSFTLPLWGRPVVSLVSVLFGLACIYMGAVQNAPMLGTSRFASAIDRHGADFIVHGPAHYGPLRGATPANIPVYNVCRFVLNRFKNQSCCVIET